MFFHAYTMGPKSRQFLILTAKQARAMNDFTQAFFKAQETFLAENGRSWTPEDSFVLEARSGLAKSYNKAAGFANKQHGLRNKLFDILKIDVSKEEIDDLLVRHPMAHILRSK